MATSANHGKLTQVRPYQHAENPPIWQTFTAPRLPLTLRIAATPDIGAGFAPGRNKNG